MEANQKATCLICGWEGTLEQCETDDWGHYSCPECGESDLDLETE